MIFADDASTRKYYDDYWSLLYDKTDHDGQENENEIFIGRLCFHTLYLIIVYIKVQ